MSKLKICVSDRCFFPKSALMNSKSIVALAKSLGYEQVEFHPTWAVWWETLTKGKLSCRSRDISSFHINWREDRRNTGQGFIRRNFLNTWSWPFVFESMGIWALQKLEKKYRKPVVVHWPEDFDRYRYPIVELQSFLGLNLKRIEDKLKKGEIKGVLIDTDKFTGWLKAEGERENHVLRRLFPYIKEIHFRFGHKEDLDPRSVGKKTKSARVMKKLVEMGYKGRVVVEMGWPDSGSIEVLQKLGLKKTHQKIISFLKSL
jgi:hypothetical protein